MSNYTRTIYNLDLGFVIRYKVDNIGFILKNKVEMFYTNSISVYSEIYHFLVNEDRKIPLNEKELIDEVLKNSSDNKIHMYLSEKPHNTMKQIREFLSKFNNGEYQRVVIKFGTKPSKYLSKRLP